MTLRRFLILLSLLGLIIVLVSTFTNPHKIITIFEQVRWYVVPLISIPQLVFFFCF